jgi:hypothetical protein
LTYYSVLGAVEGAHDQDWSRFGISVGAALFFGYGLVLLLRRFANRFANPS